MLAIGAAGATRTAVARDRSGPGQAAAQSIARLLGRDVAGRVDVRIAGEAPDRYELAVAGGRIRVEAGSPVAAVRAVYAHLNAQGHAAVSWEGDRVVLPARLPDRAPKAGAAAFTHRLYLNTCTFGYTTPFWGWREWEREIDRMAANGIDMPLALEGQEAVWQALWREHGVSDDALAAYFSGPAFLPWQRMGNIEGYQAPLPQAWIDAKRNLQRRILSRMRELGMTPVLPAFGGYVPRAFAERHPNARIYRMRAWEGFRETWWLDPADPLFAKLARRFLELQAAAYGPATHFLADAFNEMVPPIADDGSDVRAKGYGDSTANAAAAASTIPASVRAARLAAYGDRLYRSIADVVPGATWVMQGWLFGADKAFWTADAIAAFLSRVPDRGMLVLDIGNDRYPDVWRKTGAFGGKDWAYGYVHNYGGSNPVYGDLQFYRRDIAALHGSKETGRLSGFGMFPEGLHSNWIVYAHNYDLAYGDGEPTLDAWLARYLRARYGSADAALLRGWQAVVRSSYVTRYWTPRWWGPRAGAYLFFKRPTNEAGDYPAPPGDTAGLRAGIETLLTQAGALRGERLFVHDVVELARHYATLRLDGIVQATVTAYRTGRLSDGDEGAARMRELALAIDALLGVQRETLASWLGAARDYGRTAADRAIFVKNARLQVTIWGGEGNLSDYASKAWAGMYRDYYLPRWAMFLDALRVGTDAHAALRGWERRWCDDPAVPPPPVMPADPLENVAALLRLAG